MMAVLNQDCYLKGLLISQTYSKAAADALVRPWLPEYDALLARRLACWVWLSKDFRWSLTNCLESLPWMDGWLVGGESV